LDVADRKFTAVVHGKKWPSCAGSPPFSQKIFTDGAEISFGIIKSVLGFRQFLLRGANKVSLEWELVCLAYNFRRFHTLAAGSKMAKVS
jgi:hypothetical protein